MLIDGEDYFAAFREAALSARRRIIVLGWDLDSQVDLVRGSPSDDLPARLGPLLGELVKRTPTLEVRLLIWDAPPLYVFERELLTSHRLAAVERIHLRWDDVHPTGASQHQKVVVIDDRVAFLGGFDLSRTRWDTRGHARDDERRESPRGGGYEPFHDVQVAVVGPPAAALGELARRRWTWATGEELAPIQTGNQGLPPAGRLIGRDLDVGLSLTLPAHAGREAVLQTEPAILALIQAARQQLYIENQYLTAASVAQALARRLAEPDGPDVVVVTPRETAGWFEESTMGVARERVLHVLRRADHAKRLRVCYPVVDGDAPVYVHSKLLLADQAMAYIGSANLTSRSFGLDSECGLLLDARGDPAVRDALAGLEAGLVAEHLGRDDDEVRRALASGGGLIDTLDRLGGGARDLAELEHAVPGWLEEVAPDSELIDSADPLEPERVVEELLPVEDKAREDEGASRSSIWRQAAGGILLLLVVSAVALLWRYTPLGTWLAPAELADWARPYRGQALVSAVVVLAFTVAAVLGVPLNALLFITVLGFGAVWGATYALSGTMGASLLSFLLGRRLGEPVLSRLFGSRVRGVMERFERHGILAVVAIRLLPVAPFAVVNLVAGAVGLRLRHYLIGTFIGLLPSITVIALWGDQVLELLRGPSDERLILVIAGAAALLAMTMVVRRLLARHRER